MKAEILELSREQYDALQAVNWSTLKHMDKSPAHYRAELLLTEQQRAEEDTDARKLGRVTHLATLEPELFASSVAVWHGERRAGKEWEAFCAKHRGKELLRAVDYEHAMALSRAVRADEVAGKYLRKGQAEVSIRWEAAGVVCKSRLDFLSGSFFPARIVDLKTTKDASPDGFGREAFRLGYHIQAAMYADAYYAVTGDRLSVALVAVEKEAPHVTAVYRVPDALLEMGRARYLELLEHLKVCRQTNHWPGYAYEAELELQFPAWARPPDEEDDGLEDLGISIAQ